MKLLKHLICVAAALTCVPIISASAEVILTTAPQYSAHICTISTPYIQAPENKNSFTFCMEIWDYGTNHVPHEGLDVRLEEYAQTTNEEGQPRMGERIRTLAKWNTSDFNPMVVTYDAIEPDHFYALIVDELPEGWTTRDGSTSVFTGAWGDDIYKFTSYYSVAIKNELPFPDWDFPVTTPAKLTFDIIEYGTWEAVSDLDLEVVRLYPNDQGGLDVGETILTWNSNETPTAEYECEMTFERPYDHYYYYGMRPKSVPDDFKQNWSTVSKLTGNAVDGFNGYVEGYAVRKMNAEGVRTKQTHMYLVWTREGVVPHTTTTPAYTTPAYTTNSIITSEETTWLDVDTENVTTTCTELTSTTETTAVAEPVITETTTTTTTTETTGAPTEAEASDVSDLPQTGGASFTDWLLIGLCTTGLGVAVYRSARRKETY